MARFSQRNRKRSCCKGTNSALALLLTLASLASAFDGQDFQCPQNLSLQSSDPWNALRQVFPGINIVAPTGNPYLGKQNSTYCCIVALNDYLRNNCVNTPDIQVSGLKPRFQIPCGAQWDGDVSGAPVVEVSYPWAAAKCPGWQLSSPRNLPQWLWIGFLLPAVIFYLNIARRHKIKVWDQLFPENINNYRLITAALSATIAMLIVILDTILWLLTVFALAAPLLLSGLHEARLDKRVIDFIDDKEKSQRLPVALRARMLLTVLCGNLDLCPTWSDAMALANALDVSDEPEAIYEASSKTATPETIAESRARSLNGRDPDTVKTATDDACNSNVMLTHDEIVHGEKLDRTEIIDEISCRLMAMLACQYSFGSTIGAPVLFYIVSFLYTLFDIRQTYGDSDVAHTLSFGMWWMVIPHIAIVTGFLLGGNNPNTLEGIVGNQKSRYQVGGRSVATNSRRRYSSVDVERLKARKWHLKVFERVYEATYKPASMWNRGRSKQSWFLVLYTDSLVKYKDQGKLFTEDVRPSLEQFLNDIIMFGLPEWIYLGFTAIFLVFIPCIFGFCLSYWTPQVGLACRSLTLLLYACAQALLTIVWMIRTTWRDELWCQGQRVRRSLVPKASPIAWIEFEKLRQLAQARTTCSSSGLFEQCYNKRSTSLSLNSDESSTLEAQCVCSSTATRWPRLVNCIYYCLSISGFGVSIFTAIGGTLLQIMGVYRNNICRINITFWLISHRARAMLQLSSDSAESIAEAKGTWTIIGSLSVTFLIMCCYFGWWYQKRLRKHFTLVASKLDSHS